MGLVRLALIRLRRRPSLALAQLAALSATLALAAGYPLVGAAAEEVGFHAAFDQFAFKRFVTIESPGVRDAGAYAGFEQLAAGRVRAETGDLLVPGERYEASSELQSRTLNGAALDPSVPRPTVAALEGLPQHATLKSGSWPQAGGGPGQKEYQAVVSTGGAELLDLKAGDLLCAGGLGSVLGPPAAAVSCFRITGVWAPRSVTDPYWGVSPPTTQLQLAAADLFAVASDLRASTTTFRAGAVFAPDGATLHAADAPRLETGLKELRGEFLVRRDGQFSSGLDRALDDFEQRAAVAAFTVQLVGVQLLLVALYFVAFATAHVLEQQREVVATWRARGWGWGHVFALLASEVVAVAVIALPIGLGVAWLAAAAIAKGLFGIGLTPAMVDPGGSWRAIAAAYAVAVAAALAPALLLSRRPPRESARRARPDASPWWRRRGADLVLALLAVPILLELRIRGSAGARVAEGADPVSLLLPALALALLSLASLRLLPPLAQALQKTGRVGSSLAGWQLARRPWAHAQLALLLSFTVAIGLFAAVYSATEARNAADRVAYATGSDLRFQLGQSATTVDVATVTAGLSGVTDASELYRTQGSPGSSAQQMVVLAVDSTSLSRVAWTRPDLAQTPIPDLLGEVARADHSGVPLPSGATTLSLWLKSPGLAGTISADVTDSRGAGLQLRLGDLDQTGWRQLTAAIPTTAAQPLRLVDIVFAASGSGATAGTVLVNDLQAGGAAVQDFTARAGWWRWPVPTFADSQLAPLAGAARDGRPASPVELHLESGRSWLRPAPTTDPVPAVLSSATLDHLGIKSGQTFTLRADSRAVPVHVVGSVDYFPTLYPQLDDFVIVSREALLSRLARDGDPFAVPNEAWLKMAPADAAVAGRTLAQRGDVVELSDRAAAYQAVQHDPLRLELSANLLLGFVASLALAALAFLLHTLVSARGRLAEYAVLRANGLSPGQIERSLLLEESALLVFSLIVGTALAAVLVVVVLPALELASDLEATVPPTVVAVDPLVAGGSAAAVLLVCLVAGRVASRAAASFDLVRELRQLA